MSMLITRLTLLGALAAGLGLLATTTQGCDGTAGAGGPAMDAGIAGATDASATDAGATDADGGGTADAGTAGAAGSAGAAGVAGAGGTSGTAGSTPATCDTTCAKADACCNAINVTYDHGADKCAYTTMCAAGQGADACAMYLQVLPQLLLPGMPLPAACE